MNMAEKRERSIWIRMLRILPAFLLASVIGVLLAHFAFRIPTDQLTTVVSVPIVSLFLVNRTLITILSAKKRSETDEGQQPPEKMSFAFLFFGIGFIVSSVFLIASLVSAPLYGALGFGHLMRVFAFQVASLLMACAFICFFMMFLIFAGEMKLLSLLAKILVWKVLTSPTNLGD